MVNPPPWKSELTKNSDKYHLIGAWVAVTMNPLWSIADYFSDPIHWKIFLAVRLLVTGLTLAAIFLRKKISPEWLILVPFLGIALQNAYMYSVMDLEAFRQHTFACIALFIGGGMLILWQMAFTIVTVSITLIASFFFFASWSPLSTEEILTNGGLLTATVAIFSVLLIQTRYRLTVNEIKARLALAELNQLLEIQKSIVEAKNKDITDSIRYAKRIQGALLPEESWLKSWFPESFIFYQPRDILSGDFFWLGSPSDSEKWVIAADCTGHGVPGALMSILGSTFLNEIILEKKIFRPDLVLHALREKIIKTISSREEAMNKDGMDIAVARLRPNPDGSFLLQFAGAQNPAMLCLKNETIEIEADKFPAGAHFESIQKPFTLKEKTLYPGDRLFLFSDGFADQFGGEKEKKFMFRRFRETLASVPPGLPGKIFLENVFKHWKGGNEQTDDVLVIGIFIPEKGGG